MTEQKNFIRLFFHLWVFLLYVISANFSTSILYTCIFAYGFSRVYLVVSTASNVNMPLTLSEQLFYLLYKLPYFLQYSFMEWIYLFVLSLLVVFVLVKTLRNRTSVIFLSVHFTLLHVFFTCLLFVVQISQQLGFSFVINASTNMSELESSPSESLHSFWRLLFNRFTRFSCKMGSFSNLSSPVSLSVPILLL